MRKAITDFFIWYCDWCDSTHLVPHLLRHEYRQFCPACGRQSPGVQSDPEFASMFPA